MVIVEFHGPSLSPKYSTTATTTKKIRIYFYNNYIPPIGYDVWNSFNFFLLQRRGTVQCDVVFWMSVLSELYIIIIIGFVRSPGFFQSLSLSLLMFVCVFFLSFCMFNTQRQRYYIWWWFRNNVPRLFKKKSLIFFFLKASILFPLKFSLSIYVCVFIGYMHCSKEEKEDSLHPSISLYWSFSLWLFFFEKKDAFFSFFRWMSLSVLYNNFFIFMAHVCVVVVVVI